MKWLFLFFSAALFGQMEQATLYFEAKEYPQAKEEFARLLEGELTPWQRAVATYDLATTYLEMGKELEALNLLFAIPTEETPLLNAYVKTNSAIAFFRIAEKENTPSSFKRALLEIQKAKKANCALQKVMGEAACTPKTDLMKLEAVAKERLVSLLEKKRGVPELIRSLNLALSHLNFLQNENDPSYRKFFVEEQMTWIPLWEEIGKGKDLYLKAISYMEKGEDQMSRTALNEAKELLSKLPQPEVSPIEQYEWVLSHDFLFPALIDEIQDKKNQELLNKAKEEPKKARLYLMEALQTHKRIEPKTAKERLKAAIEEQQFALSLARQGYTGPFQERVIQIATPFLKQVYQEQVASGGCASSPWDEVLPLFHKGFREAEEAQQVLAIHDWKEALSKWDSPSEKQEQQDKTTQELQQMQLQDRVPVKKLPVRFAPGVKPW